MPHAPPTPSDSRAVTVSAATQVHGRRGECAARHDAASGDPGCARMRTQDHVGVCAAPSPPSRNGCRGFALAGGRRGAARRTRRKSEMNTVLSHALPTVCSVVPGTLRLFGGRGINGPANIRNLS
ncbi:hypothetical protein NDU88_000542 [Pleurodeles waltl]|uniref:Uncharacterized protein n=1 Tax=Pleurodeles waltl TaxID=8319 RepID=A0AAV7KVW4_PLEWA|nr:hypothetical protein NDU88_000542 [Pleurodeles waltl]